MKRYALAGLIAALFFPNHVFAWGDEGHEVVGLIADHYLDPAVHDQVTAMLATDTSGLAAGTDIAHEATWADKYRDAGDRKLHYTETENWHFVDIEIDGSANIDAACFQHPAVPAGTAASAGPAKDCSIDKITQFAAELHDPTTAAAERLMALQFLLHFVGDEHQPLHSSDDHDAGGNGKKVKATGLAEGKLHAFWDTQFVQKLPGGTDPNAVATQLIAQITVAQQQQWISGTPSDWAEEAFQLAHDHSYALLPAPDTTGLYTLSDSYVQDATQVVSTQLQRAGVRLASVLNAALGTAPSTTACSSTSRASALPDLSTVTGISISISETSKGTISMSRVSALTSTLSFDANNPNGLQKTIEAKLLQAGWTLVEVEGGAKSYLSRWVVPISGCAAETGLLTVAPSEDGTRTFARVEIQN